MIRRKNRFMVRLSDDEKQLYDALRIRARCEEWADFFRQALRQWFDLENGQRPITLPNVQKEKEFPLVDGVKKTRKPKTKKPAKKRAKVAIAG